MAKDDHISRQRFVSIVATLSLGCAAGLVARAQGSAAGMTRFTDSGFGFSFWYPASWKVTNQPVADPTEHGWFPEATIVRVLTVANPAVSTDDNQAPGVMIREIVAPRGLTELGASKSASPVGVDQRYFFDSAAHRWMYARLSDAPDGRPPSTSAADIRQRTMGGLPIFWGAMRHGAEVIVPLDASHFLAISAMDPGGYYSHVYLAPTIAATDASRGKPANRQVQADTIRREAIKLFNPRSTPSAPSHSASHPPAHPPESPQ